MPNRNDDRGVGGDSSRQGTTGTSAKTGRTGRSNRGFASMDPAKQREIASKGGRAAHAKGTAHEFDSTEAREAGRKGGMAVSRNREHMAMIGRRGGEARGAARSRATAQTNTGGTPRPTEGAFQNTRAGSVDREIDLRGEQEGVRAQPQGQRGSLGGERRPASPDQRDTGANH